MMNEKVICIANLDIFTNGKVYEIVNRHGIYNLYQVRNDNGHFEWIHRSHFKTIVEHRDTILDSILENE